jgi:hypothetical protein
MILDINHNRASETTSIIYRVGMQNLWAYILTLMR